ncbi:hypothetical protein [Burkholderia sp. LMU1-1-1.1]|uniref:hypothetical protein n=1 Tax=Burkholderia sp. LMU1-1-1.1 TaxID=3135266 RepID=UPI00341E9A20
MRILVLGLLAVSSVAASAAPVDLCWTDKLELSGNELRVFPTPDYVPRIYIKRNGNEQPEQYKLASSEKYFILLDGDIAYLGGGPHDNCTLIAMRGASGAGVQFHALFRPTGLPPVSRKEFIVATKPAEDLR